MSYDLCVLGGLGRAGLPLSIAFATRGRRVLIYDINREAADLVRSGTMPFVEDQGEQFLGAALASGHLHLTHNIADIAKAAVLVVVIGTPVDDHLNPKLEVMLELLDEIEPHVRDGQTIMMRSTVFPGTTALVRDFFLKRGRQVEVAFCPERIAEGKAFEELFTLPQIVSAFEPRTLQRMRELFEHLGAETVELEPMEAELGKLFTNSWRYCQFAISNQFYMVANNYNLDFYKIYDAITHRYPRISGMARPGFAAGPCLFKDTLQLAAFNNNVFGLGYAAMTTNEGLPNHIVERLRAVTTLKDKTVGILGMAFKGNSDDPRGSLSYKLRRILRFEAGDVLCTDVYLRDADFVPADELVERADLLILATPHREYLELDLRGKPVVDVWNFFGKGGLVQA